MDLKRILDFCEDEQSWLVETTIALAELESPTSDPSAVNRCGDELARRLRLIGAEVELIEGTATGRHLRARVGQGQSQLLLLGHIDTVWPVGHLRRMPIRQEQGRLHGPGVYDMKAGIAIGMLALRALDAVHATLVEADRIVQERIAQSAVLQEWWGKHQGSGLDSHMELTTLLSDAGGYLGEEIVVTGSLDEAGEIDGPVILAELTDPQAMRDWLEQVMAKAASEAAAGGSHDEMPSLIFLEGAASPLEGADDSLFVWLGSDTLIAAPRAELVRAAAARSGLSPSSTGNSTGLKGRLAEIYGDGAETLVAVNAREIAASMGRMDEPGATLQAERLGLTEASHLIFQQKRFDDRTDNSAVLSFDGPRSGVLGWLAEPAPMGSLRYISPDAKLVAAAVVIDPTVIVDQLIAIAESESGPDQEGNDLETFEQELGLSLRDDFAAALGGEFALALDGPVVPEPPGSWWPRSTIRPSSSSRCSSW